VQTSTWWLITRELDVFLKEGKQVNALACAPDDVCLRLKQFRFDWEKHRTNVKKLQVRIMKAQQVGRYNKN
jgi:hypothetical protein